MSNKCWVAEAYTRPEADTIAAAVSEAGSSRGNAGWWGEQWQCMCCRHEMEGHGRCAVFDRVRTVDTVPGMSIRKSQPGHRQTLTKSTQTDTRSQTVVKQTSRSERTHIRLRRLAALTLSLSPLRTPREVVYVHTVLRAERRGRGGGKGRGRKGIHNHDSPARLHDTCVRVEPW